jgi:hypothetical protein
MASQSFLLQVHGTAPPTIEPALAIHTFVCAVLTGINSAMAQRNAQTEDGQ